MAFAWPKATKYVAACPFKLPPSTLLALSFLSYCCYKRRNMGRRHSKKAGVMCVWPGTMLHFHLHVLIGGTPPHRERSSRTSSHCNAPLPSCRGSEALTYMERRALGHGTVKERLGKVSCANSPVCAFDNALMCTCPPFSGLFGQFLRLSLDACTGC